MDPVTLEDVAAPDSVLSVKELNRIDNASGNSVGGIPPDTTVIICAIGVQNGASGAQLSTLKDLIESSPIVLAARPAVRLVSRAEIDMPVGTTTSVTVSAGFSYAGPAPE